MDQPYAALLPVVIVAAVAPVLTGLLPSKVRLPQVVVLLVGGVLIGPQVLDLARPDDVTLLSDLGLGLLFLLAGYELDPAVLRERAGHLALTSWLVSLALASILVAALYKWGVVHSAAAVTIALTTTALGTILPILRDNGLLGGRFGRLVFASGAAGELCPIVAMSLLLGSRHSRTEFVLLIGLSGLALLLAFLPRRLPWPKAVTAIVLRSEHETSQSTLRITIALLVALLALAAALGFDSVLGAFVAGMVLRTWSLGNVERLEQKLDVVGWGVFIPVFFISSGMGLDIRSIAQHPFLPLVFLLLILFVRGGPTLLLYRRDLPRRQLVQLALFSSTTLPLLVALTEIALADGTMRTDVAAALLGAGALSVLIFPLAALSLRRPGRTPASAPSVAPG